MMKRFVSVAAVLMVAFAIFGVGVAMAQEKPAHKKFMRKEVKEKRLLHQYDVFFYQMEKHRIGMEAIIDYVNEQGDTNASAQLVVIKDSFVAMVGELETAANAGEAKEFRRILKDARGLTKDFRLESHSVLDEGGIGEARTKVNEALEENKDYLQTLLDNIRESRRDREAEIIDEANDRIQKKIDHIKEKGRDVDELQAKLDEIKEKKDALKEKLEAALASCEGVGLRACDTSEAQEYKDLKEEIKKDYKELHKTSKKIGKGHRILKAIKVSHKVMKRTEKRISKAEEAGADVAVAKAKLDEVKDMLAAAEALYNEGDYKGALAELKNAREALKKAGIKRAMAHKREALEKAKERREEVIGKVEERREEALEKAKERRNETIEKAKERREEVIDKVEERREEAFEKAKERRNEAIEMAKERRDEAC